MRRIAVTAELFDAAREAEALRDGRTDVGAVVSFVGYCRDEAGTLTALELEHFPGMAEAELERISAEAEGRWPLLGLSMIHRYGVIRPGEPIVLVATASRHRAAAFAAAEFLMDFMKTDAPFWKREHREGSAADPRAAESWVNAKATDGAARARWAGGLNTLFIRHRAIAFGRKALRCRSCARHRERSVAIHLPSAAWIARAASPPRNDVEEFTADRQSSACPQVASHTFSPIR